MRSGMVIALVWWLLAAASLQAQSQRPVPPDEVWRPRNYPELRALMEGRDQAFVRPLVLFPERQQNFVSRSYQSPPHDGFVPSRQSLTEFRETGIPRLPPLPLSESGIQQVSGQEYPPGVVPPAEIPGWTQPAPQPATPPMLMPAPGSEMRSALMVPPAPEVRTSSASITRSELFETAFQEPSGGYSPPPVQAAPDTQAEQMSPQMTGDWNQDLQYADSNSGNYYEGDHCDFAYEPIDCGCHHHGRFLPFMFFGPRLGDDRSMMRLGLVVPIRQRRPDSLLFLDFRGDIDFDSGGEGNFGLVYKTYLNPNWIFGSYIYYDLIGSSNGNTFNQMTVGLELLSVDWDFRVNGHLPASGAKGANVNNDVSHGTVVTRNFRERAYEGIDAEIGRRMLHWGWNDSWQLYWFVGGYAFEHDAQGFESFGGPKTRLELRISDLEWLGEQSRMEMAVEGSWDRVRDGQVGTYLRCRIPLWRKARRPKLDTLRRRMVDLPVRDID